MKISNKIELQQTTFNNSSDIDFKEFINLHRNVLKKTFFLVKALKVNPNFKSREKISAIKYIRKFYYG